jgi:hypothetical protein
MFAYIIISKSAICVRKAFQTDNNAKVLKCKFPTMYKVAVVKIGLLRETYFRIFWLYDVRQRGTFPLEFHMCLVGMLKLFFINFERSTKLVQEQL